MTRAEAIEVVKRIKDKCNDELHGVRYVTDKEALDMAIDALEQNESAEKWYKLFVKKLDEQEPCDKSSVCDNCIYFDNGKGSEPCDTCEVTGTNKTTEQEPCEDAISREAAIKVIRQKTLRYTLAKENCGMGQVEWSDHLIKESDAIDGLNELPPVQPSRKGHWIEVAQYSDGKHKIECSECGNYIFDRGHANSKNVKEKYKYCNYCGADMRGDTE